VPQLSIAVAISFFALFLLALLLQKIVPAT
jgi:hypothetical protein